METPVAFLDAVDFDVAVKDEAVCLKCGYAVEIEPCDESLEDLTTDDLPALGLPNSCPRCGYRPEI